MFDLLKASARACGVISLEYDAADSLMAYSAIDARPFGFQNRDVILADELGFKNVPVGLLLEDMVTEEIHEIYRGTRVVAKGPNEWLVDLEVWLDSCPFAPGCRSERGFTTTEETFHLLSGQDFPVPQWIEGHSLAGAWAEERAAKTKASCISFAAPKIGDRAMADFCQQAIPLLVRWVGHGDAVPKVPLEIWPLFEYLHPGPATEFDATAKIKAGLSLGDNLAAHHNIFTYWNAVDPTIPLLAQYAA